MSYSMSRYTPKTVDTIRETRQLPYGTAILLHVRGSCPVYACVHLVLIIAAVK